MTTATKRNRTTESTSVVDLPDIREHPIYRPVWDRLEALRAEYSQVQARVLELERGGATPAGPDSKFGGMVREMTGRGADPGAANRRELGEKMQRAEALRMAMDQTEKGDLQQALREASLAVIGQVQAQHRQRMEAIADAFRDLDAALQAELDFRMQLRTKGYEDGFMGSCPKIAHQRHLNPLRQTLNTLLEGQK